ncbi:MAG TPA: hypothetical protein VFN74_11510, partial [Chloroflexota bacterium]|nr:hypothetical protein [Chloroflexota bacterium]
MPDALRAVLASPFESLALPAAALVALLVVLGVVVHLTERPPVTQRPSGGDTPHARPARHQHLSGAELARLAAVRSRARL